MKDKELEKILNSFYLAVTGSLANDRTVEEDKALTINRIKAWHNEGIRKAIDEFIEIADFLPLDLKNELSDRLAQLKRGKDNE